VSKHDDVSVSSPSLTPSHAEARKEGAWIDALRKATLGDYEVYGELGRGGMATVYLADDIHLGRKVAIKLMAPSLFYDDAMVQRFRREAKTAASLNHPHIIPIYAVRQSEDLLYFVMKWVDGRPLDGTSNRCRSA
jgi:serine/threonine-protein kinase